MALPPPRLGEPPVPPPRMDGPCVLPPPAGGLIVLPLRGAGLTVLPPREEGVPTLLPREGALNVPAPDGIRVRGPLKIVLSLRGTPVEINPLLLDTPMPAKVLPLNLATGSTRKTRWPLTSLKWLEKNTTL